MVEFDNNNSINNSNGNNPFIKQELIYYILLRKWKTKEITYNKLSYNEKRMFRAIARGRDINNNVVISELLYIVKYGTDYSKIEEELLWWN